MSFRQFADIEYKSIEDSRSDELVRHSSKSIWASRIVSFVAGLLTSFAILSLLFLGKQVASKGPRTAAEIEDEEWNHCGRSSKVAIEKGCVMEPLFYGWMPPQCVFEELTSKYPVFEDREWFQDKNMTLPLRKESLWKGEHIIIYTSKFHGEHCLFQWRKLQYAVDNQVEFLDNKTISAHHTGHCADQITVGCEGPHDVNVVELGFYRCRKTIW